MLFNSWQFAVFLPVVIALYYLLPYKHRWTMLLAASIYFYICWNPGLIVLIASSTVIHYFAALAVDKLPNEGRSRTRRKAILVSSVGLSVLMLLLFKYFDFLSVSVSIASGWFGLHYDPLLLKLTLPMGISFYTFQTLSYTIDVYRRDVPVERHLGYFALFITFFPQLVAGPIERVDALLPQLKRPNKFEYDNMRQGLIMIAIGLFKKIVVADTLAKGVNLVYNNIGAYSGLTLVMATVMFAFQIYCDFSGYSDIAMGSARCMGIQLMYNFKSPYLSQSIHEFWSRWHISLSTWFRDYVYIPLGGNRKGTGRGYLNLMITFLLSGMWHGANWTFFVWGGLHGLFQVVEKMVRGKHKYQRKPGIKGLLLCLMTFAFVCLTWVFFRANTLQDAAYIYQNAFTGLSNPIEYLKAGLDALQISKLGLAMVAFELVLLVLIDIGQNKGDLGTRMMALPWYWRWPIYVAFTCVVVILSTKSTVSEFIYFQF